MAATRRQGVRSQRMAALAAWGAVAGAATGPAFGQTEATPVIVQGKPAEVYRADNASTGVLGDLPLTSTPFSVNVITQDLIVNQQASYLGDFLKNDPSAQVGNVVVSFATLRGFTLGFGGFLFDGLPLGSLLSDGRLGLQAFDRIDVLKGPTTFLFGSSSLGGALNYIPKLAESKPLYDVALTYASRSQIGLQADLGQRFGQNQEFGLRFNGVFKDGDTAVDDMSWRQGMASLAGDWRISPDLTLSGGLYYVDNSFPGLQPFFVGASDAQGSPIPIPKAPDTRRNLGPSWSEFGQDSRLGWLRGDWSFAPDWTLTVQYGGGENNRPNGQSADTRYGVITSAAGDIALFATQENYRTRVQAGQALVRGKFATGDIKHDLTLGVSGAEEKNYGAFGSAGVFPGSLYTSNNPPRPPLVPIDGLPYTGKSRTTGAFVNDIVGLSEQWSVMLGGRQQSIDNYAPDGSKVPGQSVSRFSPAAALLWKPTPASLIYANYAQGLEPGGTAPVGTTNVGQSMAPLITDQYEIGAKLETGGLLLTAAVFDMQKPLQTINSAGAWAEMGDQRHRGVELLASGQLLPELRLVAGTMYLDAQQVDTGNAATDGKQVPGVPKWTANAWFDWRIGAVPGLFLNAGVYFLGKQYFDLANLQSIPSWTRFDVGARYETRIADHNTTFLLAVENVGNKSYWASALGGALTLGDPLTVKATARVSF